MHILTINAVFVANSKCGFYGCVHLCSCGCL